MSSPQLSTPQFSAPWQTKFTRRKGSIALRIGTDLISVLAPKGTPARAIHALLEQRRDWIEQALFKQSQQPLRQRPGRSYTNGESWLVNGQPHQLQIESSSHCSQPIITRHEAKLALLLPQNGDHLKLPEIIQHWYQEQAEQHWPDRLEHWAKITGLQPQGLKIRPYKSRWGSCTARGQISLNTLLVMAPQEVLDYVIVHELCHLKHLNHSRAFWQLVEHFCPTPKQHRLWLRQHAPHLLF